VVPRVILKDNEVLTPQLGSLRTEKFVLEGRLGVVEARLVVSVIVVDCVTVVGAVVNGVV